MIGHLSSHQRSSRTPRTPVSTAAGTAGETSARCPCSCSLVMARIWSVTATILRPEHPIGMRGAGSGVGEMDSRPATTRHSLTMLVDRTGQGRILPSVGPSRIHQTSLHLGIGPGLSYVAGNGVECPLHGEHILTAICHVTRVGGCLVLQSQFSYTCLGDVTRSVSEGRRSSAVALPAVPESLAAIESYYHSTTAI